MDDQTIPARFSGGGPLDGERMIAEATPMYGKTRHTGVVIDQATRKGSAQTETALYRLQGMIDGVAVYTFVGTMAS